jgi:serine phosphatase RsbU (regulator of sigma subunit)
LQFIPETQDAILLQDAFIATNEHPFTDRYLLTSSPVTPTYSVFHEKYHPAFLSFLKKNDFYDVLLIDAKTEGIVYSALKEADFGATVGASVLKNTALYSAFEQAKKMKPGDVHFEDFTFYTPSLGQPIAFWASPVYLEQNLVGVLVIKIQPRLISNIVTNQFSFRDDGLGNTGEVLVIGKDGLIRSDSRASFEKPEVYFQSLVEGRSEHLARMYLKTNSNALLQDNRSFGFREAIQGKRAVASYESFDKNKVIGAYGPIRFGNLQWVISAEVSEDEVNTLSNALSHYVWFSLLVMSLILIPVSYVVARVFLRPFKRLINTIQRIYQTQNLTLRLTGNYTTEINSLTSSFNLMLERLQKNEEIITSAKDNIEDSIAVAKRVLESKLPGHEKFTQMFSSHSIHWRPRDIVGGDVYWLKAYGGRFYLACIDCTGHGVPGAFIAMLAISSLDQIAPATFEWNELSDVVKEIDKNFQEQFSLVHDSSSFKDGFALSLLCFDKATESVSFVGMGQDALIKHADGSVTVLKGHKKQIGYGGDSTNLNLQVIETTWSSDDTYFLYSDGLTTQVGEAKRAMMGTNRVTQCLADASSNSPEHLVASVIEKFESWRGSVDVRDDLTLIAVQPQLLLKDI